MNNIFAFDVDGTLINSKGELQPFVAELFQSIYKQYENPSILFVSGADIQKIKDSIVLIEKNANLKIKNPYIIGLTGAIILNPNGEYFCPPTFLDENFIIELEKLVYNIEKYTYICYATDKGNFFIDYSILEPKQQWLPADEVVDIAFKMARFVVSPTTKENLKNLVCAKQVRAAWVFVADKEKNKEIAKRLEEFAKTKPGLTTNGGFDICVGFGSKVEAVSKVCGNNLKNLVYFGDGLNDVALLSLAKSGLIKGSVGVGTKSEVLSNAELAVPCFNQFVIDYALDNLDKKECIAEFDLLNEKTKFICTPETKHLVFNKIREYALKIAPELEEKKKTFY